MTDAIIGTPAIVGFGTNSGNGCLDNGFLGLLLAQRQGADLCNITRDINLTAGQNHVSIVESGAAAVLATETTAAATQIAICNSNNIAQQLAAAAAITACSNQAATLAAIAQCCCESKSLIIEKANQTNALILQQATDNLRDQLADAKMKALVADVTKK